MRFALLVRAFLVLGLATYVAGCGSVGMMVSTPTAFSGHADFSLRKTPTDFVALAASVGTKLGYHIQGTDPGNNMIQYSDSAGGVLTYLVGTVKDVNIELRLNDDHKSVHMKITMVGNFGEGDNNAASKVATQISNEFDKE